MAWIAMPNENGTKSIVHSDLCDYYLAHHGIKVQKLGVIRSWNKASYAITNHGAKVATKKADKSHTKYVQQAKKQPNTIIILQSIKIKNLKLTVRKLMLRVSLIH